MTQASTGTRVAGFARELARIFLPLLLVFAVAALSLRLLNEIPPFWQAITSPPPPPQMALNDRLEYPTLEAAESDLAVKVAVPSYFPSYILWPAASVRGQREPVRVVSLLFRSADGQQALQIRQVYWSGEGLPFPVPEPVEVLQREVVDVNGVAGELLLGRGLGDTTVNQLRWHREGVHLVVTTIYPAAELLRISRSIHPE